MKVGFTGAYATGKTEACTYLASKGFTSYSLSDVLRERLEGEESREEMIELGNSLRKENGPGALGKLTAEKIMGEGDFAVDSIRSPYEVDELKKVPGIVIIGLSAPMEMRFERIKRRGRPGDPETIDEFRRLEARENAKEEHSQQIEAAYAKSDIYIENDGTLEEFHNNIDKVLEGLDGQED